MVRGESARSATAPSPFSEPADGVLAALNSTRHGLGAAEAGRRLVAVGANVLPETPPPSVYSVFVRQFASPFIYVLLLAAALALLLKEWADAGFIGVVVVLNAAIGTLQEARAERSAHALRQMMTTTARVVRDGDLTEIDAAGLVPGDIVVLASGDKVPADLRLLDCQDLQIDESLLTGESLPVVKDARAVLPADAALAERTNMAFAGALVNRGRGEGVVVATGLSVQIGVLANELAAMAQQEPPLVMRMRRFTHWVAAVMVVVATTFAALEAARGTPLSEVALVAIALAVSAIPEGLPVALTVALAIATRKMAQRHVIVRRMAAVEALGSCTTIATDKTGTVTVNELTATDVVLGGGSLWRVTGAGAAPEGEVIPTQSADAARRGHVVALARAGVLCNEAALIHEESAWTTRGDAVDASLLVFAHKLGITRADALAEAPQVGHLPFESERRFAASRHRFSRPDAEWDELYVKGAVEVVAAMCSAQLGPDDEMPLIPAAVHADAERLAAGGRRVIALARRVLPRGDGASSIEERDLSDLVLLGLVGMLDPPRKGARAAVEACGRAGLRVVMVTGDHPATALAIAHEVGLAGDGDGVVTGQELRRAGEAAGSAGVDELVSRTRVFARVEPAQKLDIVASLIRAGELVAVTGDGANDAPALRRAHVGVAMGRGGTDVAREAADLIVADDDFSSIVAGIEEGRVAYGNIRKVISLLVSTGAGELVLFLLALATGMAPPLTAVQLLWLNLVTNGIQDVALAFEPAEGNEMHRPPRPPSEGVFNALMLERIAVAAGVIGAGAFGAFRLLIDAGWDLSAARNGVVLLMVFFENVMVLNSRSETESIFRIGLKGNRFLVLGTLAALSIHVSAMHWSFAQQTLRLGPLPAYAWAWMLLVSTTLLIAVELEKMVRRNRPHRAPRSASSAWRSRPRHARFQAPRHLLHKSALVAFGSSRTRGSAHASVQSTSGLALPAQVGERP